MAEKFVVSTCQCREPSTTIHPTRVDAVRAMENGRRVAHPWLDEVREFLEGRTSSVVVLMEDGPHGESSCWGGIVSAYEA